MKRGREPTTKKKARRIVPPTLSILFEALLGVKITVELRDGTRMTGELTHSKELR